MMFWVIVFLQFISSLLVFIYGFVHSSEGTSVTNGLLFCILVFAAYFGHFAALWFEKDLLSILIQVGGAICSIVLALRNFHMKYYYDNLMNHRVLREDEIKTKENHYYLAISSIINFILIALWVCKLIAEFGNEDKNNSENRAPTNGIEQDIDVEASSISLSDVATDDQLLGDADFIHLEPSAQPISVENSLVPPITGEPLPRFEDLEAPPPKYEDIFKTTTE